MPIVHWFLSDYDWGVPNCSGRLRLIFIAENHSVDRDVEPPVEKPD